MWNILGEVGTGLIVLLVITIWIGIITHALDGTRNITKGLSPPYYQQQQQQQPSTISYIDDINMDEDDTTFIDDNNLY